MEALDKGYFYCFELVWRTASALPRFYVGHDLGEILWLSWDFVPAAHRLEIWVQIWAQFSLLCAPSALFMLLGITEDSSEVL